MRRGRPNPLDEEEVSLKKKYQAIRDKQKGPGADAGAKKSAPATLSVEEAKKLLAKKGKPALSFKKRSSGGVKRKSAGEVADADESRKRQKTDGGEREFRRSVARPGLGHASGPSPPTTPAPTASLDAPATEGGMWQKRTTPAPAYRHEPIQFQRAAPMPMPAATASAMGGGPGDVQVGPDGRAYFATTIFIGDVGDRIEHAEIARVFGRFGHVENVRLIPGKSFGFVKFSTRTAAQSAMNAMNGAVVGGSTIRTSRAIVPHLHPAHPPPPSAADPAIVAPQGAFQEWPTEELQTKRPEHLKSNEGETPLEVMVREMVVYDDL